MNLPNMLDAKKRTEKKVNIIRDFNITENQKKLGTNKKYYIRTYGCQMNERDSENISAILNNMNYKKTENIEDSDVIILNTCSIRENANNKVFGFLGVLKNLKEKKDIITILCGCMPQEESIIEKIKSKYNWIDLIFGTHNIKDIPSMLEDVIENNKKSINVYSIEGDIIEDIPSIRTSKIKAYVNVMYGCDKFCTYCIVPYTRGKQRSRLKSDIIKEVEDLINSGYKEITLLGQNVNAYGKDFDYDYKLSDLLKDISKLNIPRIKFLTSHPWDFEEELIEVIKNNSNVLPFIHLPIQSGSNNILKIMNRRYTKEQYINLYKKIKEQIPNCVITTDIIVGFPNESEEDFNETLDVVNTCKFDFAFTFIFSPRIGTPASLMKDEIKLETKKQRLKILNELVSKYAKESNGKLLNKTVSVLIEEESENKLYLTGYTDTNKMVYIKNESKYKNQIKEVLITEIRSFCLYGEIK